jgi:hypothetical protein
VLQPTAAISSVLVLGAFTATTIKDATTVPVPAPCPIAGALQCIETDPAYLADGALSYAIQRTSDHGGTLSVTASLVAWRAGRSTTLHVFVGGLSQEYDMTRQGQAIWVGGPARPGGPWPIWCWSGGPVTKITVLPAADSPAMVVWLSPCRGTELAGSSAQPCRSLRMCTFREGPTIWAWPMTSGLPGSPANAFGRPPG